MTYYSEWQLALIDFITLYGHNYKDAYNLTVEFELHLKRNKHGAYFIRKAML